MPPARFPAPSPALHKPAPGSPHVNMPSGIPAAPSTTIPFLPLLCQASFKLSPGSLLPLRTTGRRPRILWSSVYSPAKLPLAPLLSSSTFDGGLSLSTSLQQLVSLIIPSALCHSLHAFLALLPLLPLKCVFFPEFCLALFLVVSCFPVL